MTDCPKIANYVYPLLSPEADSLFKQARALQKQEEAKPFDEHDHSEVVRLYAQAIKLGHYKAMNNLALLYEVGYFIPKDKKSALALYKKMEKLGLPEGHINMADSYRSGLAFAIRPRKATMDSLQKAAEVGHPRSQFLYAMSLLKSGESAKSSQWMRCAYEQNYADTALYLALDEDDMGNNAKTMYYLRQGVKLGSQKCITRMVSVYRNGSYGEEKNVENKDCFRRLRSLLREDPSRTFPNLDELCPPSSLKL